MARGLDHVVHAVRDLDAAAHVYRRLGFTVGARNRHPWGTHNHVIQFPGFFIELLAVAEPEKLGEDGFSRLFGRFNRDFLACGEGLSLLILESRDAARDAALFQSASIAASEAMGFEREGRRPDGSRVTVAFSLAFARDPAAPKLGFAVCQQHFPENFWNPAFQTHDNTAAGIAGVALVAARPEDHHEFLSAFAGARPARTTAGLAIETPRGVIELLDPAAFHRVYGVSAPHGESGARLAAVRFAVRDLDRTAAVARAGAFAAARTGNRLVIAPDQAMGATLVFEPG